MATSARTNTTLVVAFLVSALYVALPSAQAHSVQEPTSERDLISKRLRDYGLQSIRRGDTDVVCLGNGVLAYLAYTGSELAVVHVDPTSALRTECTANNGVRPKETPWLAEHEIPRILDAIDRIKPLGRLESSRVTHLSVDGKEYENQYSLAVARVRGRPTESGIPASFGTIHGLQIFYWLSSPLQGTILEKRTIATRIESRGGQHSLTRYQIRTDARAHAFHEIAERDFHSLVVGTKVTFQMLGGGQMARRVRPSPN